MRRYFLLVFFCIIQVGQAQTIQIVDAESKFPVNNAVVFNEDQTKRGVTDKSGQVDISNFSDGEIISIFHIAYIEFEILKRNIPKDNIIYLRSASHQLEEVFLSASKSKELRKRIAEQIDVVSIQQIQQMSPQTSADMLSEIPGIKIQKTQFGGGSPILRGMEANRVLLVVDGVRMNNAIYRKGHLQNSITVTPTFLDRTEVIFGPSSVIYGSDALGGVIHYYTRKPNLSEIKSGGVSLLSRFTSVNNEFTYQIGMELSSKKIASFTSISYSKFGDLMMGKQRNHNFDDWGKVFEYSNNSSSYYNPDPVINSNPNLQCNTGFDQTDILQKLIIPVAENTNINFNLQYSTSSNIPRFDRLTEYRDSELRYAEWYYGPQNRLLLASQLEIHPQEKWLESGSITLAYQSIDESRINRSLSSLDRVTRKEHVDVFSLNADFSIPLKTKNNRNLYYGIELTHNKVDSKPKGETLLVEGNDIVSIAETFPVQSRFADGGSTYTTLAGYLNYRQDISSKSTFNTGLRFTHTNLKATWIDNTFLTLPDMDITSNNAAINATVSYIYKPTEDWQFNTVASTGFRAPNVDDIGKVRERGGDVTVPNVDLKPEYAYNLELGVIKYLNKKKFSLGLTGYYTLLDDYIEREDFVLNGNSTILFDGEVGNIVANVNKDKGYVLGGTFNVKGGLTAYCNLRGSVTYTKGKAYDTGEPFSSIPPVFGMLEFSRDKGRLYTSINYKFNGRKKPEDFNIPEGLDRLDETPVVDPNTQDLRERHYGYPAWGTVNLSTRYKLNRSIEAIVNINNIFDIHYKEFASSISAPGRSFSFTLLANF